MSVIRATDIPARFAVTLLKSICYPFSAAEGVDTLDLKRIMLALNTAQYFFR